MIQQIREQLFDLEMTYNFSLKVIHKMVLINFVFEMSDILKIQITLILIIIMHNIMNTLIENV